MVLHHRDGSISTLVPDGDAFAVTRAAKPAAPEPSGRAQAACEAAESGSYAEAAGVPPDTTPETEEEKAQIHAAKARCTAALLRRGIDPKTELGKTEAMLLINHAILRPSDCWDDLTAAQWHSAAGYIDDMNEADKRKPAEKAA